MIDNIFGIIDVEFGKDFSTLLSQFAKLSNSKIVFNHFDEEVKYTFKEIQFMRLIYSNPGMKNIDIAENLQVTKGMISKIIKNLETYNVVIKKINPDNNREIQLFITDLGKSHLISLSSMINPSIGEIYQDWLAIPNEYREIIQDVVKKYTELLIKMDSKLL